MNDFRIVWRHILPNVIQPVIVLVAVGVGSAILAEAALSFLGVGVQEPTASLGLMISRSRSFFSTSPHLLFFPGRPSPSSCSASFSSATACATRST